VNGFGLAKCCENVPLSSFPATATTVHFEFFSEQEVEDENGLKRSVTNVIHVENVDKVSHQTSSRGRLSFSSDLIAAVARYWRVIDSLILDKFLVNPDFSGVSKTGIIFPEFCRGIMI
jgi:hypothetical protein